MRSTLRERGGVFPHFSKFFSRSLSHPSIAFLELLSFAEISRAITSLSRLRRPRLISGVVARSTFFRISRSRRTFKAAFSSPDASFARSFRSTRYPLSTLQTVAYCLLHDNKSAQYGWKCAPISVKARSTSKQGA
jgi:hypothetical protein